VILCPHPDPDYTRPPEKVAGMKFIGYWTPQARHRRDDPPVLLTLPDPRDYVDPKWSPRERKVVLEHLSKGTHWEGWMGPSWCRFGCEDVRSELGCEDLTDGVYVWPKGFAHYILAHYVRPPQEFVAHVLGRLPV
jgi:hypothetical protein